MDINFDLFRNFIKREPNVPLMELEKRERESGFPIIRQGTQDLIRVLMSTVKPEYILELGTGVGFSGILMAEYNKNLKLLDTIELKEPNLKRAKANIEAFNYQNIISCHQGDALKILETGQGLRASYDFIFVDCAKAQYAGLWQYLRNLVRPGGIILTDDILQNNSVISSRFLLNRRDRTIHKRMREYLFMQLNDKDFTGGVFEIDDGVTILVRNDE